jgi:hypothetical protein
LVLYINQVQNMANIPVSTEAEPQQPALLALPPELRNAIYDEVVLDGGFDLFVNDERKIRPHPLSMVCRQLHCEFTPIWNGDIIRSAR